MDPLSIAATVAGLISLADSTTRLASSFISEARHAQDSAQSFVEELDALQRTLKNLRIFLSSQAAGNLLFRDTSLLLAKSKALKVKLTSLHNKLEHASKSRLQQLIWPIQRKEYESGIAQIRAFCQVVHFALQVDTCALLSKTSDDLVESLGQQLKSLKLLDSIEDRIAPLEQAITGQTLMMQGVQRDEKREKALDWLADAGQETYHDRIRRARVIATGQWLLNDSQFVAWKTGTSASSILWCSGEMGAGKTTLSSLVIDQLSQDLVKSGNGLAFFYFTYSEAEKQTFAYVLGSILRQLLKNSPQPIPHELSNLQRKHASATATPTVDLLNLLKIVVQGFKTVSLVFDAVDECVSIQNRKSFLDMLQALKNLQIVRSFVTSRPHLQDIQTALAINPIIKIEAREEDIKAFVRSRMKDVDQSDFMDPEFRTELSNKIVQSAHGIFLLPALQLDRVLQEPTRGDMEDALEDLPSSLFDTLSSNMSRVLSQSVNRRSLALNALMWLSQAFRPLKSGELCDVLSMNIHQQRPLNKKYRPTPHVVVECCQGLIYLDNTTMTFRLVHYAVKEHLIAQEMTLFGGPLARLTALTGAHYLLDPAFDLGPPLDDEDLPELELEVTTEVEMHTFVEKHPFLEYIALFWGTHAENYQEDLVIRELFIRILTSIPRVARVSQISRFILGLRFLYWDPREAWSTNGLHLACEFRLTQLVCDLINRGVFGIDSQTELGTTAIIKAASTDQLETMRELLKRGADPYCSNWYGNALHCAAEANSAITLRELLDRGFDPNILSPKDRTSLSCTLDNDSVECAAILLEYDSSQLASNAVFLKRDLGSDEFTSLLPATLIDDAIYLKADGVVALMRDLGYVQKTVHSNEEFIHATSTKDFLRWQRSSSGTLHGDEMMAESRSD